MFVNDCLELSAGKAHVTAQTIKDAEISYSQERLQSLSYEWNAILPDLQHTSRLLSGMKSHFEVSQITQDFLSTKFEEIAYLLSETSSDPITKSLFSLYTTKSANFESVRGYILREFYAIGLIGIKTGPTDAVSWSQVSHPRLNAGQIRPTSDVHIHPMFHRALGIKYRG